MFGRLHSLEDLGYSGYAIDEHCNVYSYLRDMYMNLNTSTRGYLFVRLKHDSGVYKNVTVHRLIASVFLDRDMSRTQVDHIDGNKLNNRIDNLRWVSNRENAHAAMKTGLMRHAVFMEDEVVRRICERLSNGESISSISRDTGYPYHSISAIRLRRNWTHISDEFVFPEVRKREVLNEETVRKICIMISNGFTDREIFDLVETNDITSIRRVRSGRNFGHISKDYF